MLARQYYSSRHFRKTRGKQGTKIKEKKGDGGRGREKRYGGREGEGAEEEKGKGSRGGERNGRRRKERLKRELKGVWREEEDQAGAEPREGGEQKRGGG